MRRSAFLRPAKTVCLAIASVVTILSTSGAPLGQAQLLVRQTQIAISDAIDGPQFSDAAFSLEQYHTLSGTYDGAAVEGRRITVRWATDRTYCIDGVSQGGAAEYLLGPNGQVEPGRCPAVGF